VRKFIIVFFSICCLGDELEKAEDREHGARLKAVANVCKILARKPEGGSPFGTPRYRSDA
jgi:hypothetical protein